MPRTNGCSAIGLGVALAIAAGCARSADGIAEKATAALTVPLPPVTQFVVLASRTASFGARTAVTGGSIGVAASTTGTPGSLITDIDSRVGVGRVLLAQSVTIRDRATTGEVGGNQLSISASATTGPRSAFVAPPAQPVPGTITPGTNAVNVAGGQTSTLAAGRFGAVSVDGTLNLSGGLYEIQSLRLVVAGSIDTSNTAVGWGVDGQVTALVVARGVFRAGDRLTAAGAIAAQDVILGNDSTLAFDTGFGCGSNDSCNDNNSCTTDACVAAACVITPVANGTACNDGNACTRTDTCQAGTCAGGNPVTCAASDQCHVVGVCNTATGVCSNPASPDGTACNDGNACTRTDTCQAGTCSGGNPVTCTAADQCHVAGVCNNATGVCSSPASPDGTACNDGNACTQTDTCRAGACTGTNPVVCAAADQCHVAGVCNNATGVCSNPPSPDGTTCNDGNACTRTDACLAGVCSGRNPVTCTASDQCHAAGTCDPGSGACSNPALPNGTRCDDGNACTQSDSCQAGACAGSNPVSCTASDQCHTAGACDPASGTCSNPPAPNGTRCDDANACTQGDTCQAGACTSGSPVTCTANDQCHDPGTCNPATGACSNPARADGTGCDDGSACTRSDTCQAGVCKGGDSVTCTASDQCHDTGSCDPATGACSNPPLANGTACNDGSACTQADSCQGGSCMGGSPVTCAASDQCHAGGTCDPATGVCSNPTKPDGTACDDGNVCNTGDTCQAGTCAAGPTSVVTELATGVAQPASIVPGADQNLWFISPESHAGGNDGAIVRLEPTTGAMMRFQSTRKLLDIVWAPDGNLWYGEMVTSPTGTTSGIGRMTTSGTFLPDLNGLPGLYLASQGSSVWSAGPFLGGSDFVFALASPSGALVTLVLPTNHVHGLASGPDGNIWAAESNAGSGPALIARITPLGGLTEFPVATPGDLDDLTAGPDGAVWFTDSGRNEIGRISTAGAITKFAVPTPASGPDGITAGPDGNLWFTERLASKVGWVTPAGVVNELVCPLAPGSGPTSITTGSDRNIWLTETATGKVARVRLP